MRSTRVVCALLALALMPFAGAMPATDMASAQVDDHGVNNACPVAYIPNDCPFTYNSNGTLTPGDDAITSDVFVDDATVTVRTPTDDGQAQEIGVQPSDIRIHHPINRDLNQTWLQLNDSRPDVTRSYVAFESRPRRDHDANGNPVNGDWGLFLTVYLPRPYSDLYGGSLSPFAYCWDTCTIDNQSYVRGSEDELQPFPDGLIVSGMDGKNYDTDFQVSELAESADYYCLGVPIDCPTGPARPAVVQGIQAYEAIGPNVILEDQVNRTALLIEPQNEHGRHGESQSNATFVHGSKFLEPGSDKAPNSSNVTHPDPPAVERAPVPTRDHTATNKRVSLSSVAPATGNRVPPNASLVIVAAGAVATALFVLGWALYSRIRGCDVLDQETRRRIYEELRVVPGQRAGAIANKLGLRHNIVKYHLRKLQEADLVRTGSGLRPLCFPIGHSRSDVQAVEIQAQPTLRAICAELRTRSEADHTTLAKAAGVSLVTVGRAVQKLEQLGVVSQARDGRRALVRLVRPVSPIEAPEIAAGVKA